MPPAGHLFHHTREVRFLSLLELGAGRGSMGDVFCFSFALQSPTVFSLWLLCSIYPFSKESASSFLYSFSLAKWPLLKTACSSHAPSICMFLSKWSQLSLTPTTMLSLLFHSVFPRLPFFPASWLRNVKNSLLRFGVYFCAHWRFRFRVLCPPALLRWGYTRLHWLFLLFEVWSICWETQIYAAVIASSTESYWYVLVT